MTARTECVDGEPPDLAPPQAAAAKAWPLPGARLLLFPGYVLVALALLGCLARHPRVLATEYIGGGEIEGWLWRYWWLKQYLTTVWTDATLSLGTRLDLSLQSSFYPEFGNLLDLLVVSWPLEAALDGPLVYNLKIVAMLALNGCAAYALARGLGAAAAPAWFAGLAYGFNPYFLSEIANGRVRHAIGFSVALYMLSLWRSWKEGGNHALWAAFWWAVTTAIYLYYGMFLLFFNGVFVLWTLLCGRREAHAREFPARFALVHVVALLLVLPSVRPYIGALAQRQPLPEVSWMSDFPTVEFLASPGDIARPQNILEGSLRRFSRDSPSWDYAARWRYTRALPLACSVAALVPLLFLRGRPWLWVATFVVFYALSLGPYLKGGGAREIYLNYPGEGVQLPYVYLFKYVPFFSRLFSPIRLEIVVFLAAGVLAALNLSRLKGRGVQAGVVAVLSLACLAQMRVNDVWPLQSLRLQVPEYYQVLTLDYDEGIIEVPFRAGDYTEFYQTGHQRKVMGSWASAGTPPEFPIGRVWRMAQPEPLQDNPFVRFLDGLNRADEPPAEMPPASLEQVREMGYRYVILHERGVAMFEPRFHEERFAVLQEALTRVLGPPVLLTTEPAPAVGRPPGDDGGRLLPDTLRVAVFSLAPR